MAARERSRFCVGAGSLERGKGAERLCRSSFGASIESSGRGRRLLRAYDREQSLGMTVISRTRKAQHMVLRRQSVTATSVTIKRCQQRCFTLNEKHATV